MNSVERHLRLVRIMISEELRLNAGMIGRVQFLMFPFMILVFSLLLSLAAPQLLRSTSMDDIHTILHLLMFAYGVSVGSFALFGDSIANRRFGEVSLLLGTPTLLPVSFRTIFAAFYVKDIIYYLLYTVAPLIGGMLISIPVTGFAVQSVLFLLLTATLSFLLGISLSFALSSVYVRWRKAFMALLASIAVLLLASFLGDLFPLRAVLPSLTLQRTGDPMYLLVSVAAVAVLSVIALTTLQVRFGKSVKQFEPEVLEADRKFAFVKSVRSLAAKDWIDLKRSRTLGPVMGAYVGPLALLAVLFWFVEAIVQVPIPINLIFYSAMIGFFSVSIYGWLNMLDAPAFLEVLPVKVSEMVRAKIFMLSLFALALSTVFLAGLGVARDELGMLPMALLVGYSTTAFTVSGTAYLTGLRTNSYLFDPRILARFALLCIPPLCALVILSFSYSDDPVVIGGIIAALCAALFAGSALFYRRIDARWGRESFHF